MDGSLRLRAAQESDMEGGEGEGNWVLQQTRNLPKAEQLHKRPDKESNKYKHGMETRPCGSS